MVLNLPQEHICYLLNTMGMQVQGGETFRNGDMVSGIYENCIMRLKKIRETGRDVLRLIIPDKHNRFPEGKNCMEPYRHQELEMFENQKIHNLKKAVRKMLMYGKEASNRKQEIDRQHHTIPNKRTKDQKTSITESLSYLIFLFISY